jgi:hypothetical protein
VTGASDTGQNGGAVDVKGPMQALNRVMFHLLTLFFLLTMIANKVARSLALARYRLQVSWRRLGYKPHANDIFIVSYPKSGTTWMQMILYQLLTRGEMDFRHLGDIFPYWDDLETDIDTPKLQDRPSIPRVFKSHFRYRDNPKGAAHYVYVVRDGLDVAVSAYYHARKFGLDDPFESFFRHKYMTGSIVAEIAGGASWFEHVAEWVENRRGLNVLIVRYEDLSADLPGSIRRVAEFCGIEIPPEEWPRVIGNCSFQFMRQYESKLDPLQVARQDISEQDRHFIRRGARDQWRDSISQELLSVFQGKLRDYRHVPALGAYLGEMNLEREIAH